MNSNSPGPVSAEDTAAITSISVDSPERLRNLELWARYLSKVAPGIELVVVEQDRQSHINGELECATPVLYQLVPVGGSHWKTRNLNLGAKLSARPLLLFVDCDVLLPQGAMHAALATLREHGGFVQPFNGVMAEIRETPAADADLPELVDGLPHFERDFDKDLARDAFGTAVPIYGGSDYHATGGAMACHREAFFQVGGYNENFVSYGFEDIEFFSRVPRLGQRFQSIEGYNAYHLPHPRGDDSLYTTHYRANLQEFERVTAMPDEELARYALNGFREIRYRHGLIPRVSQDRDHYHVDLLPDDRLDLGGRTFAIVVTAGITGQDRARVNLLLAFLEEHFRGYRVELFELGALSFRHPVNRANYAYTWLDSARFDLEGATAAAVKATGLPAAEIEQVGSGGHPVVEQLRELLETRKASAILEALQEAFDTDETT